MWNYNHSDELFHYGVLGMKWGVRKRTRSADSARVKQIRKKKIKEMSNQELKEVNNRLNLENQYKNLKRNPISAKKLATTFVATAATITAVTKAAQIYKKTGGDILNKIGDIAFKNIGNMRI